MGAFHQTCCYDCWGVDGVAERDGHHSRHARRAGQQHDTGSKIDGCSHCSQLRHALHSDNVSVLVDDGEAPAGSGITCMVHIARVEAGHLS